MLRFFSSLKGRQRDLAPASRTIPTVDIFSGHPELRAVAMKAVSALEVPWGSDDVLIASAKEAALHSVLNGTSLREYSKALSPSIFRTKREAHHAMVRIATCANVAVSMHRMRSLGVRSFKWRFVDSLCSEPSHAGFANRTFSLTDACRRRSMGVNATLTPCWIASQTENRFLARYRQRGLSCLARSSGDDPAFVESWL